MRTNEAKRDVVGRLLIALGAATAATCMAAPARAQSASQDVNTQLVDTMTTLAKGPYPGYRANHAKGIMASGTFTPAESARSLSKAAHLQGGDVPVLVRFSNGTGDPHSADAASTSNPHGIAIRFNLPNDAYTDIVSISYNGFPVATPEEFLQMLTAVRDSGTNVPKPTPIEKFLGSHPAAKAFVTAAKPAPTSFTTLSYFGVNAFKFTNAKGETRYGRYRIIPVKLEPALTEEQAAKMDPDYLMKELPARLANGPAKFTISAQLAQEGDVTNNGTVTWPDNRPQVVLGTLTLKSVVPDSKSAEKKIMFNPLALVDGIAPSDDPVLLDRPAAYAVSFGRRAGK
jgi:catalase